MMLAEATNEFAGQWLYLGMAAAAAVGVLIAILTYFATRRDVDTLSEDIKMLSGAVTRQNEINEARAAEIHGRLNPVETNVGRLEGTYSAFDKAFEKFTRIIEATSRANNETITAFTRSLDTFAGIVDRSLRDRDK